MNMADTDEQIASGTFDPTDQEEMPDPELSQARLRLESTAPPLDAAVDAFVDRLSSDGKDQTRFPWPGGLDDMPERVATIAPGALLPPPTGCDPRPWTNLWEHVGPLWPDRLAVLVGATGKGKSGFALCVAEAVARAGHPVLYLSAEMGTDELVARLLAQRSRGDEANHRNGVPYVGVLSGKAPQEDVKAAGAALVADCPLLYLWAPQADKRTPVALETMTRDMVVVHDGRAPLVVVDYLQRMADGQDLRQAVRAVSGKLRDLSRPGGLDHDWPGAAVLALSSTARGNYQALSCVTNLKKVHDGQRIGEKATAKVYELEGLGKESGELETDAALVLVMTTDDGDDDDPRPALVAIGKNRHGGKGTVAMTFHPASGVFTEPEKKKAAPRRKTR